MIDPLTIEDFLEHGRTWLKYGNETTFSFNQQDLKMLIDTYDEQQREIASLKLALKDAHLHGDEFGAEACRERASKESLVIENMRLRDTLKTKEEVYLKEIFKLKRQLEVKDEN